MVFGSKYFLKGGVWMSRGRGIIEFSFSVSIFKDQCFWVHLTFPK